MLELEIAVNKMGIKNNLKNLIALYVLFVFCMCHTYPFFTCLNGCSFVCVLYLFVFNSFLLVLVVSSFIVCKYTYYLAILKYDYLRNKE